MCSNTMPGGATCMASTPNSSDNKSPEIAPSHSTKMSTKCAAAASNTNEKQKQKKLSVFLGFLRIILIDIPLSLLFVALLASLSANYLYDTYYIPLMNALQWPGETSRDKTENTYYARHCTANDITTRSAHDLIIPPDEASHDASLRTQKHGMAVFPKVVSDDHAATLRDYILNHNAALKETDMDYVWLISGANRWSFKLGADAPGAADVLRDISTHPKLRPTLEELLGDEPALVELTAITSAYGAGDQHFHQDNSHDSCQMGYARSFVSMYSIFIPLQDTTKEMGATDACAGTHYCSSYDNNMCYHDDNNIRVLGTRGNYTEYTSDPTSDAKYWKAGDAFLFDMPVIHRGPAHIDPTPGNERVMLILTVSPRPRDPSKHGFDRRQLGLGTSYSNRWDMWGMTLSDLEDVESAMFWRWRLLRTLGIYKRSTNGRKSAVWGFDFLSVTATRLMNKQFGYRMNDLRQFINMLEGHPSHWINNGVAKYLFAHRHLDWLDWLEESLDRSKKATVRATGAAWITVVMLLVLAIPVQSWKLTTSILVRNLFVHATIFSFFAAGMLRLQMSPWTADLLSDKSMTSPFADNNRLRPHDRSIGPTKLPVSRDVLLGNARLNSRWMASHNRMNDFHPGNGRWLQAMDETFDTLDFFSEEHPVLEHAALTSIASVIWSFEQGDFLKQIDSGDWIVLSGKDAAKETRRRLMERQSGAIKIINEEIAYQISECRHGPRRDTSMSRFYCTAVLEDLQRRLFRETMETRESIIPMPRKISSHILHHGLSSIKTLRPGVAKPIPRMVMFKSFKLGDDIVAFTEEGYWREGKITAGPDQYGRYSIRLIGANHARHGYTEVRLRYLSETDRTLIEGTMAEDDEYGDGDEGSSTKARSLSSYLRLGRCSARFKCEFAGEEGDMDCSELIE